MSSGQPLTVQLTDRAMPFDPAIMAAAVFWLLEEPFAL